MFVCMYVYMCMYVCVYVYVYMCVYMYIYIYTLRVQFKKCSQTRTVWFTKAKKSGLQSELRNFRVSEIFYLFTGPPQVSDLGYIQLYRASAILC